MRYTSIGLAVAAVITLGAGAQAAPLIAAGGLGAASKAVNLREDAQYVWGGYQYCWYDAGWRGPGWYRCGFDWRRGYGWGGPMGWRGWHHGDRRFYGERRFDRDFRGSGGPGPAFGGPPGGGRPVARPRSGGGAPGPGAPGPGGWDAGRSR